MEISILLLIVVVASVTEQDQTLPEANDGEH
jgi:hypothetical protein